MFGQVKRFGELVSSNVESLIDKATDPRKMLLLLRSEIEDSLLKLHKARADAAKRAAECEARAARLSATAEEWTAKARLAMDKGREDLARSALLARESDREEAARFAAGCAEAHEDVAAIETTIAEMEAKRAETIAKLEAIPAPSRTVDTGRKDKTADRQRSRIEEMERRTAYNAERDQPVDPAQVDDQFDALQRDSAIEAELEAMRPAKGKKAKK